MYTQAPTRDAHQTGILSLPIRVTRSVPPTEDMVYAQDYMTSFHGSASGLAKVVIFSSVARDCQCYLLTRSPSPDARSTRQVKTTKGGSRVGMDTSREVHDDGVHEIFVPGRVGAVDYSLASVCNLLGGFVPPLSPAVPF